MLSSFPSFSFLLFNLIHDMGNTTSNENSDSSKALTKIPKHLQPIKKKPTPKKSSSNSAPTQPGIIPRVKNTHHHSHNNRHHDNRCNNALGIARNDSSTSDLQFRWTQDRHRVQFYVIRWAFGSRHIVPPEIKPRLFEGIRVLDVNCGPGLWVGHPILDMAQDFVRSTFNLVDIYDLLPQQPVFNVHTRKQEPEQKYPNFTFILHNILQTKKLPFDSNQFDYAQQHITALTYKQQDWPIILKELSRVVKPGGYIQLIEIDLMPQHLGPQGELWLEQIHQVLIEKRNTEPRMACQLEKSLLDLGLVDVQSKFVSIPLGSWGLDLGNLWKQNFESFFDSAKPFLTELMEISGREYKRKVQAMLDEFNEYKPFSNIYLAWGRVPDEQQ
ncbi:hypothetical protein RMCBS344292_05036 [Rhizopus microsporus]|nr:hypothetical protein RMCBS344292_05036 [Rhizopus microsporus]